MFDVIIRGGKIINGSGEPAFKGDIGIRRGEIASVGNLKIEKAHKEINAKGKYVTPGFIDINNHSDSYWTIFKYPNQTSLVTQGITTIVGGNCGSSLAPIVGEGSVKSLRKWARTQDLQIDWQRMGEFLDYLEEYRPISVNFATLVGHATIRRGLLGEEIRRLKPSELKVVEEEVEKAIKEGAWGISTGLTYTHARIATTKEITSLAKIAAKLNALYVTHMRGDGEDLISSIKEALNVAKASGVELKISHLKAVGKLSWPLFDRALELIEKARKNGVKVDFDIYPYISSGPVLYTLLPGWITEGSKELLLEKLKKPATRLKVINEMRKRKYNYSKVVIASSPLGRFMVNKDIAEIAKRRGVDPEEIIVDLITASEDHGTVIVKLLSEKNVEKGITHPRSIISSDGIGYDKEELEKGNIAHPRCFGAFPKFLSYYVKEKKALSIEKAIQKITTRPAQKIGFKDRGEVKEGMKADINIIDWDKIKDLSTIESPFIYSEGMEYVLVNGEVTLEKGKKNKVLSGKVLRK